MCKPCLRVVIGRPWGRSLSMLKEPQAGEESDEKAVEPRGRSGCDGTVREPLRVYKRIGCNEEKIALSSSNLDSYSRLKMLLLKGRPQGQVQKHLGSYQEAVPARKVPLVPCTGYD